MHSRGFPADQPTTLSGERSEELWSARKNALWHALALRPGADILITDVAVPISRLVRNPIPLSVGVLDYFPLIHQG